MADNETLSAAQQKAMNVLADGQWHESTDDVFRRLKRYEWLQLKVLNLIEVKPPQHDMGVAHVRAATQRLEPDRAYLQAIASALGLAVPPGEDAPTLVGRILNAAHQLRRDHDTMAKRCAEYEREVGHRG